jgi:hypothetical protein
MYKKYTESCSKVKQNISRNTGDRRTLREVIKTALCLHKREGDGANDE